MKTKSIVTGITFILIIFYCQNAYAYLDPGTGSMLLQGLIAGILVVGSTIGIYWRRIKKFLSRFTKQNGINEK